jgi:uncharacterized protein
MGLVGLIPRIYLDSDGLIDLVNPTSEVNLEQNRKIAKARDESRLVFVTSELTIVESLVYVVQHGDFAREREIRAYLQPTPSRLVVPISRFILEEALQLRVAHGLRTPDAIHIATGTMNHCDAYLTKDAKWPKVGVSTITIAELADLVSR